jgi:hypothetical protein
MTEPRSTPETGATPAPHDEPQYGPESVVCTDECGAPPGKPCVDLDADTYHCTRVVAANIHRARDVTRRLLDLTAELSNRLRPGTVSTTTYQAEAGRLQDAFSTLLFHLKHENLPVMPEEHDEILALNDVLRGGL